MYKGNADWTLISKVKNNPRIHIPVFGNGDVDSPEKAKEMRDKFGLDGAMIGRASIGYPWIFKQIKDFLNGNKKIKTPSIKERVDTVKQHLEFSIKWKGETLGLLEMRRHYTNYFRGIQNFKEHRIKLIQSLNYYKSLEILDNISKSFTNKNIINCEQIS